jgi:predicted transcriptional regulator of viral defense system
MKKENLSSLIKHSLQKGRYSFEKKEVIEKLGCSTQSFINSANRLAKKKELALVKEGFYVIIPPQHFSLGCLPADWFIDDLMKYLDQPYYISLLSAASYYGASHQQPQRFQVITNKQIRLISVGNVLVEFIVKKTMPDVGINKINSYTSSINISSPELTMIDICDYPKHAGYIHNMAQVITDLADSVNKDKFKEIIEKLPVKTTMLQRLGYLLDITEHEELSKEVYTALLLRTPVNYIWLNPGEDLNIIEKNKRWNINVNEKVELDI